MSYYETEEICRITVNEDVLSKPNNYIKSLLNIYVIIILTINSMTSSEYIITLINVGRKRQHGAAAFYVRCAVIIWGTYIWGI